MAKNEKLTIEKIKQSLLEDITLSDIKKEPQKKIPQKPKAMEKQGEILPEKMAYIPPRPNIERSGQKVVTKVATKSPQKEKKQEKSEMVETSMGNMSLDEFLDIMSLPEEEANKKIAQKKEEQERRAYENRVQEILAKARAKKQDSLNKTEKLVDKINNQNNGLKSNKIEETSKDFVNNKQQYFEPNYISNLEKTHLNNENNFERFDVDEKNQENSKINKNDVENVEKMQKSDKKKQKNDILDIEKEENKKYKNTYIYGFIFIIGSILFEIVNFVTLGIGFLPTAFIFEIAVLVCLAGIIFIVPTEVLKISIMSIFFGVQIVMNIVNASLYKVMYELVTTDMIFTLGAETADAFEWGHINILSIICHIIVLAIVIFIMILANKLMPKFRIRKNKTAIVSLLILIFSVEMVGFSGLKIIENAYFSGAENVSVVENAEYWYNNTTTAKFASLKKYGFWSYYFNNFGHFLNYQNLLSKEEEKILSEYVSGGENFVNTNSTFGGNNVSGSLAGDNLIMIMLESAEWFAIDPYNTPHLYDFIEDNSIKFTNYHARNKTNVSEQISILGGVPYEYSLATISDKVGISAGGSLANLFKSKGYESVNFFHDYRGDIYQRNTLNKELGFTNVYAMEQSPIANKSEKLGDFMNDGEFISSLKSEFMPSDKSFFSYFTTVSTHGPYQNKNTRFEEYYDKFETNYTNYCAWVEAEDLGYLTPARGTKEYGLLKEYKSRAMALDNMINVILNHLKTTRDGAGVPLYDNTTIVMFADHNCYYSDLGYIIKDVNKYANNTSIYNVPFAIFNKSLGEGENNDFCSTFDIYPSICDLYGLKYNKNLVQGNSVFSENIENSVFVSSMAGMFDDYYYTTTLDDFTEQDETIDALSRLAEFKEKLNKFFEKQNHIETYYRVNFDKNR